MLKPLQSRLSLVALLSLCAPTAVQAQIPIFDTASFTGSETLIEFEGFTYGDRISAQYASEGVTFVMSNGMSPYIETSDTKSRPSGPDGVGCLQNFPRDQVFPVESLPDLYLSFAEHGPGPHRAQLRLRQRVVLEVHNNSAPGRIRVLPAQVTVRSVRLALNQQRPVDSRLLQGLLDGQLRAGGVALVARELGRRRRNAARRQ